MNAHAALEKLRDQIRRRHLALATERTYCAWLRRFIDDLRNDPSPELSSEAKVERFLTRLAQDRRSSTQQNLAFSALVFFYTHVLGQPLRGVNALRVRTPSRVRIAPSRDRTLRFLAALEDPPSQPVRLIAHLLYGCGMRLNEALALRVKDVDLDQSRLWIRDGKHGRDRVVALPDSLVRAVADQVASAEDGWRADFQAGIPVTLPGLLAKKNPHAAYRPDWRWLFPAEGTCIDPRSGRRVRWHCHPAIVQRGFARTSEKLALRPPITPHHLRHAYATHCLDSGANVRALQAAMGHKSLETTMRYLHADALSVASPLDRLPHSQVNDLVAEPRRRMARVATPHS